MFFIYDLFARYPILGVLQLAFKIWMLYDAYKRRADLIWFLVIFFLPILGPWVYFFVIKVHDFSGFSFSGFNLPSFQPKVSLKELRYRAAQTPSLANHLALAEALIARREYEEAMPHLEQAQKREPDHSQVLYQLAVCHVHNSKPDEAIPLLNRIIDKDPRWSNYSAWHLRIEAHDDLNNSDEALQTCRDLVKLAPTLQHKCLLAEHLLDQGQPDEVTPMLELALQDHSYTPAALRRRNRRWASEARRLLRRVRTPAS